MNGFVCVNNECQAVFLVSDKVLEERRNEPPACSLCKSSTKVFNEDGEILSAEPAEWDSFIR